MEPEVQTCIAPVPSAEAPVPVKVSRTNQFQKGNQAGKRNIGKLHRKTRIKQLLAELADLTTPEQIKEAVLSKLLEHLQGRDKKLSLEAASQLAQYIWSKKSAVSADVKAEMTVLFGFGAKKEKTPDGSNVPKEGQQS